MDKIVIAVVVIVVILGVYLFIRSKQAHPPVPIPAGFDPIVNHEAVLSNHGQQGVVTGIYTEKDVRKRRPGDNSKVYAGHVILVLEDGRSIFLYPPSDELAIRSKDEIKKYKGRKVWVKGKVLKNIPQTGAASVQAPCIIDIEEINLF